MDLIAFAGALIVALGLLTLGQLAYVWKLRGQLRDQSKNIVALSTQLQTVSNKLAATSSKLDASRNDLRSCKESFEEEKAHALELRGGVEAGMALVAAFGLLLKESDRQMQYFRDLAERSETDLKAWQNQAIQLFDKAGKDANKRLQRSLFRLILGMVPFGSAFDTLADGIDIPDTMRDLQEIADIFEALKTSQRIPDPMRDVFEDLELDMRDLYGELDDLLEPLKPGKWRIDWQRLPRKVFDFSKALHDAQKKVAAQRLCKQILQSAHPLSREWRKHFDSRSEFASAIGVSAGTIANLESGKTARPKSETLEKLADGLKLQRQEVEVWFGAIT